MKSTNFKYAALMFSAAVFSLSACSDFLDKEPDERVDIQTEEQVNDLLNAGYPHYNYGWLCEISSDNLIDNNAPHTNNASSSNDEKTVYYNLNAYDRGDDEAFRFEPVRSNTSQDSPTGIWQGYYNSVAVANHALRSIDEIAAKNGGVMTEALQASRGEALLLRAYSHFILVNVFSQAYKDDARSAADIGVPYVTEPENTVSVDYPRGTVTETYAKIKADLEEGLSLISDVNYGKPKWRFNTNAAHAFAARFYLFTHDYDKVIEHANAVLGTDRSNLPNLLMKYDKFTNLTYISDYANVWQSPDDNNNLMLLGTYSLVLRRLASSVRYAFAGDAAADIVNRDGPTWSWTVLPAAMVSGMGSNGDSEYGSYSSKIGERFEYSDKVSGIGYVHTIRREFTCTQLLLERAEALLLSKTQQDIPGAVADLIAYEDSRQTFDEVNKNFFTGSNGRGMFSLTDDIIKDYYAVGSGNPNCFDDWSFTANMGVDVPAEVIPYMNCLNDFRRYETVFDGIRFFDLKRWGIEYTHYVGRNSEAYTLTWNDPRRALEVPQEVISAGMEPSRPVSNEVSTPEVQITKK